MTRHQTTIYSTYETKSINVLSACDRHDLVRELDHGGFVTKGKVLEDALHCNLDGGGVRVGD